MNNKYEYSMNIPKLDKPVNDTVVMRCSLCGLTATVAAGIANSMQWTESYGKCSQGRFNNDKHRFYTVK